MTALETSSGDDDEWVTVQADPNEQPQASRERPALPAVAGTPFQLIRQFFEIQEKRAVLYSRFKDGFAKHVDGVMDGGKYHELCVETTIAMSRCSLNAIAIEEELLKQGKETPAACIRVAQIGEKTKLHMTCTLQVLKKRNLENRWSWQQEGTDSVTSDAMALLEIREAGFANAAAPAPSVAKPSFANGNFRKKCEEHPNQSAEMCSCQEAALASEPTQADFEGAVREATQTLEDAVIGINDALEELRYELEDEEEGE